MSRFRWRTQRISCSARNGSCQGRPAFSTAVDVSSHFSDPDGDALAYSVSSSHTSLVKASVAAGVVSIVTRIRKGSATVTVTARDPGGLAATQSIPVTDVDKSGFLQVVLDYPERDIGALVLVVQGPSLDSVTAGAHLDAFHLTVPGGAAVFIAGDVPRFGSYPDFLERRLHRVP